jgi:hypothetical protein
MPGTPIKGFTGIAGALYNSKIQLACPKSKGIGKINYFSITHLSVMLLTGLFIK